MEHAALEVTQGVTVFFSAILFLMVLSLALEEKIHAQKSVIVSFFAILSLVFATALGLLPFGDVTLPNGHLVPIPVYIPAVDWGVIAIILGSSVFVDVTSRSGLFTWVAIKLTKASNGFAETTLVLRIFDGNIFCRPQQRDSDDHHRFIDSSFVEQIKESGSVIGVFVDRGIAYKYWGINDLDQLCA